MEEEKILERALEKAKKFDEEEIKIGLGISYKKNIDASPKAQKDAMRLLNLMAQKKVIQKNIDEMLKRYKL